MLILGFFMLNESRVNGTGLPLRGLAWYRLARQQIRQYGLTDFRIIARRQIYQKLSRCVYKAGKGHSCLP